MVTGDNVQWLVLDINPEPWAVGPLSTVRTKGGSLRSVMGRNQELYTYQQAIKSMVTNAQKLAGNVAITVYLWRKLEEGFIGGGRRTVRDARPDATNMLKAAEDALQGLLYDNDENNVDVRAVIVERSPNTRPLVVIKVEPYVGFNPDELPDYIWKQIDDMPEGIVDRDDNTWG